MSAPQPTDLGAETTVRVEEGEPRPEAVPSGLPTLSSLSSPDSAKTPQVDTVPPRYDLDLEQRVEARTRELSTLLEVTRNITSTLRLEPLLGLILDQFRSVVDYDGAWIYSLTGDALSLLAYRATVPSEALAQPYVPVNVVSIDQEVIRGRKPIIIPDVRGDSPLALPYREALGESLESTFTYIRSWMGIPLLVRDRVIGKLTLDHSKPNRYTDHDADLALAFAGHVAIAIENARLYEREQRRATQLAAVQRVSAAIASTLDLTGVLQLITQAIREAAGFEVAVVSLVNGDPPMLHRSAAAGLDHDLFETMVAHPSSLAQFEAMSREEYRLGGAYYFPGASSEVWSREIPSYQVMEDQPNWRPGLWHPRDMLIEPLIDSTGRLVGAISVDKPFSGMAPTIETVEILDLLAQQATIAIVNARLYQQAKESAASAERSRLARDLHDAVTQTLFSASLIAEVLPRLMEQNPKEGMRRIEELRQLTRGALAEMRTLLLELRPSALTDVALGTLLRQLAEAITGRTRIPISLEVAGESRLPPEVQIALYRVAQEALNNVAKHSEASRAVVSARWELGRVSLAIADDGRGFDTRIVRPDSLGLGIMRERIEAIGAELSVETQPGRGTTVSVVWSRQ